jgi:eukaryotic-like serine/threonine-protein kinase
MALSAGTRIGSYEVASQIGAGGMGEVYRATDTKLKRQVAIKVLPDAVAADPERLARFQREAEILASLNHQNIAQLHGFEETDGLRALVMELVEGPTLADRIALGAVPVDEALAIAKQIVAALEAAHEQGITHRDLKPANVKVRPDGTVKVLDFGLAKLADPDRGSNVAATMSPTLSLNATMAGVILGTAAYMAPEQARGKAVDKRADIWACGAVLYEMLTASQPFPGEDISHVLARVIDREPDWTLLPSTLAPSIRTCLQRCLVKDPRQRIRDIGDVRLVLDGAFESPAPPIVDRGSETGSSRSPFWKRMLPAVALSVVLASVAAAAVWFRTRPGPDTVTKFVVTTPSDGPVILGTRPALALAPDGTLAYPTAGSIYLRRSEYIDPVPIRGSEGRDLSSPFFSRDGVSVGYIEGFSPPYLLKRVPAAGGPATTITQLRALVFGLNWGHGNTIVFGSDQGLFRVSANGGSPEQLTRVTRNGESHRWPFVLPDGRNVLFAIYSGSAESSQIAIASLETGTTTPLGIVGTSPTYAPSGHMVYSTGGSLHAVGFDVDRLKVTTDAVTALENVLVSTGTAYYSIASNGTLVYYASPPTSRDVTLALVDGAGEAQPLGKPGAGYQHVRVSRDGRWVAYQAEFTEASPDIAVLEIGGSTAPLRLTFGGVSQYPVWSGDGRRIIFQSNRDGASGLFWQMSDGTGMPERLTTADKYQSHIPESVSRDGTWLTFSVVKGQVSEVWRLSLKTKKTEPLIVKPNVRVAQSVLSPDGQWIAYQATTKGVTDIFVEPVPPTGARYQVPSANDNHHPIWAPDSRALYYVPGPRLFARLPIATTPRFGFGTPEPLQLNSTARTGSPMAIRRLDIMPDGKKFVGVWPGDLGTKPAQDVERRIVMIQHWDHELKRLLPTN